MTYKNHIEKGLLLSWILILFSINSNFYELNQLYNYKISLTENIINYFNFLRFYLPFIIFFFFLITFVFTKKKFNYFLSFFFIYFFYQFILATILNYNVNTDVNLNFRGKMQDYQLLANAISTLFIFYYSATLGIKKFNKKLLIILIIFIAVISIFFTSKLIFEFLSNENLFYLYGTSTLSPDKSPLFQANIRVTGLSRMLLLIFFLFYFINLSNPKLKSIRYLSLTIIFVCIFFIYGMQSRGSWVGILLLILLHIFFYRNNFKKALTVLLIIFLAIFLYETILKIKIYSTKSEKIENTVELKEIKKNQERLISTHTTSGRILIWANIIKIIKDDKIIFGKGPQSDRHLITEYILKKKGIDYSIYEHNASNAILYSYLCAGVIGLITLISIYLNTIILIYKNIFVIKNFSKKNILINFSTVTLSYLLLRSIFENSFTVFSVDYVFFILSYFIAKKIIAKK